ncbi:MAG: hypothetical protein M0R06_04695 [Sphaerochaeta sp.]|jgi:hypothetical protein|nr:hypothetical protein [Sphaerochaeta sp.]
MKAAERAIWMILAEIIEGDACTFCRYNDSPLCSPDLICIHPLPAVRDAIDIFGMADCWGFRPHKGLTISDVADIVGIILANGWDRWSWYISLDGKKIEVSGYSRHKKQEEEKRADSV